MLHPGASVTASLTSLANSNARRGANTPPSKHRDGEPPNLAHLEASAREGAHLFRLHRNSARCGRQQGMRFGGEELFQGGARTASP